MEKNISVCSSKRQKLITDFIWRGGAKVPLTKKINRRRYNTQGYQKLLSVPAERSIKRNGFLFRATNNYTQFTVHTTVDSCEVCDNKEKFIESGTQIATATIDSDSSLTFIEVRKEFRRRGIGTNLIRFINECAPQFHCFGGSEHNSTYRMLADGRSLIISCINKGILKHDQLLEGTLPRSP
jgi:GNAT superfamily N-acetyltransferase